MGVLDNIRREVKSATGVDIGTSDPFSTSAATEASFEGTFGKKFGEVTGTTQQIEAAQEAADIQQQAAQEAAGLRVGAIEQVTPLQIQAAQEAQDVAVQTAQEAARLRSEGITGAALIQAESAAQAAKLRADAAAQAAGFQAGAAAQAAGFQTEAAQAGIAEQRKQFDLTTELLGPYVSAGRESLASQQALLGQAGPEAQAAAIAQLESSPLFSALTRQSEEALLQTAAATGGVRGGNVQRSLAELRPAILSRLIEDQFSKLTGITQAGQSAAMQQGLGGQRLGSDIANLLGQVGGAQAGGALGVGEAQAGGALGVGEAQAGGILGGGAAQAGGLMGAAEAQAGGVLGVGEAQRAGIMGKSAAEVAGLLGISEAQAQGILDASAAQAGGAIAAGGQSALDFQNMLALAQLGVSATGAATGAGTPNPGAI
jgi:hypothetical protein